MVHPSFWVVTPDIETIVITVIHPAARRLLLATYYRPPTGGIDRFTEELGLITGDLSDRYQKIDVVLAGDANIDLLTESVYKKQLVEFLDAANLKQIIDSPTRISKSSYSLIDHIYVRAQFISSFGRIDLGLSDHYLIYLIKKKELEPKHE